MQFIAKLTCGVALELKAIAGVVRLLRWPCWTAWVFLFLVGLVGVVPQAWSFPVQGIVLLGIGLLGVFSGRVAQFIRRRQWVGFPRGRRWCLFCRNW